MNAPKEATQRLTISCDGTVEQHALLYAITRTALESALYDTSLPRVRHSYATAEPLKPKEDGTYWLVNDKWIRGVD